MKAWIIIVCMFLAAVAFGAEPFHPNTPPTPPPVSTELLEARKLLFEARMETIQTRYQALLDSDQTYRELKGAHKAVSEELAKRQKPTEKPVEKK